MNKEDKVKFVFSGNEKSGMNEMDKVTQAKVIYESSKGSAYYKASEQKAEKTAEDCKRMLSDLNSMNDYEIDNLKKKSETLLASIELGRSFKQIKVVLDADAFYASVEIRDRPELVDLPVAVGHGVITTCNYVARKFGVRSAMPGFIAKKLCPNLVFLDCNFDKYIAASEVIRNVIEQYDPKYHSGSLDEVYFDITNAAKERIKNSKDTSNNNTDEKNSEDNDNTDELWSVAHTLVEEIRARITKETRGLTCSAGIANNSMLAKICSNIQKPNGQYLLPPTRKDVKDFMSSLPTRKVPGVGKVFETILDALNIKTMGDVHNDFYKVLRLFSPKTISFLASSCLGINNDGKEEIEAGGIQKSIGKSQTFSNLAKYEDQVAKLKEICKELFEELTEKQLIGFTITLKLKTDKFKEFTRSRTYANPLKALPQLEEAATNLLAAEQPITLRLLGVSLSKLKNQHEKSTSLQQFFKKQTTKQDNENKPDTMNLNTTSNDSNDDGLDDNDNFYIFEDYKDIDNNNDDEHHEVINNNDDEHHEFINNNNNDRHEVINDNNNHHHQENIIENNQIMNKSQSHKINDSKSASKRKDNDTKGQTLLAAFKSKKQCLSNDDVTTWICDVCTYNHISKEESNFLQCSVCFEPRTMPK